MRPSIGKVLVPMSEHIQRLVAVQFQWDLMGTENLSLRGRIPRAVL